MFVQISHCDEDGQYLHGFAVEVKNVTLAGVITEGFQFDIIHMDGEKERLVVGGQPYRDIVFNELKTRVMQVRIVDYPDSNIVDKDEFRAKVGKGRTLNAQGHFVFDKEPA